MDEPRTVMTKAILIDDEPRGLTSLRKMLEQHCADVQVIAECTGADSGKDRIAELKPDLVFLDISMPGKNGFDMLSEMETIDFELIFVTAHNDYTLQAFRYSAVDYLMKPVDEDLLSEAVKRAIKRIHLNLSNKNISALMHNIQKLQSPSEMKLCVPSLKGFQVINLEDVIYCEAESSYTIFHLVNKQHIVASKSMVEYEALLDGTSFCRVHKSFLVNLIHIKEYHRGEGGTLILTNNMEVEVSRRKKDIFIARMKQLFKY
jgi:two-component system, LytTR family, response regulator